MLPTDAAKRKEVPIYSGFFKYFPLAIAAVAELSRKGNEQHNPGKPLHWDRSKSGDELDAQMRHVTDMAMQGDDAVDADGELHATKNAWRSMANLQKILERKTARPSDLSWPWRPRTGSDANPWRLWSGGTDAPCGPLAMVLVKFRNDNVTAYDGPADGWDWKHSGHAGDIVAWKYAADKISDANPWRPWHPSDKHERPLVGADTFVKVRFRTGNEHEYRAVTVRWSHEGTGGDIVAWKYAD